MFSLDDDALLEFVCLARRVRNVFAGRKYTHILLGASISHGIIASKLIVFLRDLYFVARTIMRM